MELEYSSSPGYATYGIFSICNPDPSTCSNSAFCANTANKCEIQGGTIQSLFKYTDPEPDCALPTCVVRQAGTASTPCDATSPLLSNTASFPTSTSGFEF